MSHINLDQQVAISAYLLAYAVILVIVGLQLGSITMQKLVATMAISIIPFSMGLIVIMALLSGNRYVTPDYISPTTRNMVMQDKPSLVSSPSLHRAVGK